jgi:hypothetical protein
LPPFPSRTVTDSILKSRSFTRNRSASRIDRIWYRACQNGTRGTRPFSPSQPSSLRGKRFGNLQGSTSKLQRRSKVQ